MGGIAAGGRSSLRTDERTVFGGVCGDGGQKLLAGEREAAEDEFAAADVTGDGGTADRENDIAPFEVLAESIAREGAVVRGAWLENDLGIRRPFEDRHILRGFAGI